MRVILVGAGIMGLTTAWSLAKRGHQVTLLEQAATIPGSLAASGDQHRMIRRAYGALGGYATLITEAYEAWDELWADLGTSHYVPAGILSICQEPGDEADRFRQGFDDAGTPYERLRPEEAAARYRFLDAATFRYAFHTPEGGALLCRRIAADLLRWLTDHGVEVRTRARVASLDPDRGTLVLEGGEALTADLVVTTAGAWTLRLLPELAGALQVYRTAVVYLDPPADLAADWAGAPAILSVGGACEGYVLPPVAGTGLKFGAGFMKRPTDDPDAHRTPEPGEGLRLRDAFAPPFARIAEYRVREVVTCAYTFTADHSFHGCRIGKVLAVSACSGHAYKFGAAIGRRVAEAVDTGRTERLQRWLRAEPV
jgi:sarcosine oxidase